MYIIANISVTSRIVINMQTREFWAGVTKSSFVKRFQHLNNKNNVCKQTSSGYTAYACLLGVLIREGRGGGVPNIKIFAQATIFRDVTQTFRVRIVCVNRVSYIKAL